MLSETTALFFSQKRDFVWGGVGGRRNVLTIKKPPYCISFLFHEQANSDYDKATARREVTNVYRIMCYINSVES